MDAVEKNSRRKVLAAYDKFLTACSITTKPRNRAYALGILSGALQAEVETLQTYLQHGRLCWGEREILLAHLNRVEEVLSACSKLYINNEV